MTLNPRLSSLIEDVIPTDHADQVNARFFIDKFYKESNKTGCKVLDLGCGAGNSINHFQQRDPNVVWHGVDIESSPEVNSRSRTGSQFHTYDGLHLPFEDSCFDIVYSTQVFEHIRYPFQVMKELARVLKDGGVFLGSVSYMEPYHSFSYWNFTPFGWYTLLQDVGLRPIEFRPGIDGVALTQRQYLGMPAEANAWFRNSPLNQDIDKWGKENNCSVVQINLRKLQFCGHLVFFARKSLLSSPS